MTTLQEALPCPFCGKQHTLQLISGQELMGEDQEFWQPSESFGVVCDASQPEGKGGCGAMGGFKLTEEEAIEAWNTRTALAQAPQTVAQPLPVEQMASNVAVEYQLRAMSICQEAKKVSVSMVQRKLGISYNAAQEVCQSLVDSGFVPGLPISPSLAHGIAAANKKGTV